MLIGGQFFSANEFGLSDHGLLSKKGEVICMCDGYLELRKKLF